MHSAALSSNADIPVIQAANIDKKIDDGSPITGSVVAAYINNNNQATIAAPNTTISGGNAASCYDTTTNTYSTSISGGTNPNCALSFKMLGAAR